MSHYSERMTDCPRVGDARLLWHVDYWDGPLRGLAHHNGRDYWFAKEVEDPDDSPTEWRFFLYPLTDEELEVEHEEHRRYQKYFGRHDDYDANGVDTIDDMSWEEKQPPFWERKKKFHAEAPMRESPDYESRPPIAWFTWRRQFGGTYFGVEAPLAELERRADFHARGILSDSAFAKEKRWLLDIRDWNERANAGDQDLDGDSR
jgi:hypothetical protein